MFSLLALSTAFGSQPLRRALKQFGREATAFLDAMTSPVAFVTEVKALRGKPGRTRRA